MKTWRVLVRITDDAVQGEATREEIMEAVDNVDLKIVGVTVFVMDAYIVEEENII